MNFRIAYQRTPCKALDWIRRTNLRSRMMKKSTAFLVGVAFAFCLGVWCQPSEAQTYPPINSNGHSMVPGYRRLSGRAIAAEMTKILKVPVVTINKPGGGSTIGANFVARRRRTAIPYCLPIRISITLTPWIQKPSPMILLRISNLYVWPFLFL